MGYRISGGDKMFFNLIKEMRAANLSIKDLASLLNLTEKTAYDKFNGGSEFTYSELMKIKKFLFPNHDFSYLFEIKETSKNDDIWETRYLI
jgi:transcriptional regulator with XRE-family HTH domain